ncbi:uncharacterized [Tachysurus ichikawai]
MYEHPLKFSSSPMSILFSFYFISHGLMWFDLTGLEHRRKLGCGRNKNTSCGTFTAIRFPSTEIRLQSNLIQILSLQQVEYEYAGLWSRCGLLGREGDELAGQLVLQSMQKNAGLL